MLKKAYRGKELGISNLLLKTVMEWSIENGLSKLYLGTMTQFKAAQGFNLNNGFQQIPENELPPTFPKNPMDKLFFVKDLNPKNGA